MEATVRGKLYIVLGVEFDPLFDAAPLPDLAAQAILSAMPTRVSHEGNVYEVTATWRMTPEELALLVNGEQPREDAPNGAEQERERTDRNAVARIEASPKRSDRKAQPGQRCRSK